MASIIAQKSTETLQHDGYMTNLNFQYKVILCPTEMISASVMVRPVEFSRTQLRFMMTEPRAADMPST